MFDTMPDPEMNDLRQRLLAWFAIHQRPLPWRRTYAPYQVWISEIMGQQTQMDRVAQYFLRWIDHFPTLVSVAEAPEQEVLKLWEGLGYYSRARNIQRAARQLLASGAAEIPADYHQLRGLPGIGPYTAAAILSIAYNQPYPLLDANVQRLFTRLADIDTPIKQASTQKRLHSMAERLLGQADPRCFNQALMELGALVCTPKKPSCPTCPVQPYCAAFRKDTVEFRPLPTGKRQRIDIVMACGILQHGPLYYIQQRLPDDIWAGLWEFPGGRLEENEAPLAAATREVLEETGWLVVGSAPFATVIHHYTRYRVTLHSFLFQVTNPLPAPRLTAATQYAWVPLEQLSAFPFPAGHRQLVDQLKKQVFPESP